MKKTTLLLLCLAFVVGCRKDDLLPDIKPQTAPNELKINGSVGIKLQNSFVTDEVAMNVKSENAGKVVVKIMDIGNRVVSKEELNVIVGDNILKVYTKALPQSAYRIGLYDSTGNLLGITDFNKL